MLGAWHSEDVCPPDECQVKSVVFMARIPGAVVKSVPWPSGTLDLTPDQKLQRFRLPTRVSSGQGSSLVKQS